MMNFRLILVVALQGLCLTAHAQNSTWKFTPFLAVSQNSVNNPQNFDLSIGQPKAIPGWTGGVMVTHDLTSKWGMMYNLQYSLRGTQLRFDFIDADIFYRYSYVDLATQVTYKLFPNLKLGVGPYTGINLSASAYDFLNSQRRNLNIRSPQNPYDLGGMAAVMYQIDHFSIFARFQMGFLPFDSFFYTDEFGNNLGEWRVQHRSLQLGVGYVL
jgi:Outer membrane protein beta-barrel domain